MALPPEYIQELNLLNKQIAQNQPKDIIQYCADYFNRRLLERSSQHHDPISSHSDPVSHTSFADPFGTSQSIVAAKAATAARCDPGSTPPLFKSPFESYGPVSSSMFRNSFESSQADNPNGFNNSSIASDCLHHKDQHVPPSFNAMRRTSVSAEIMNPNSFENDNWKPPYHELTSDQLSRLNQSIVKNFLFTNLEEDALDTVLHALQEKKFQKDEVVIKQGDEGDFFYILEKGHVDFFVNGEKVAGPAGPGSSFGELALMYNAPRAATVKAVQTPQDKTGDIIVWALDRLTFRRILLAVTAKKRHMYEEFLQLVKILDQLSSYQRSKLADALHTQTYKPGEVIIKEGDVGENFYLIESGDAEIIKANDGLVGTITKGDYFGEIALLEDTPRQATVRAKTLVRVATLGKSGFQRLLGPVVEVLKAHDPRKN